MLRFFAAIVIAVTVCSLVPAHAQITHFDDKEDGILLGFSLNHFLIEGRYPSHVDAYTGSFSVVREGRIGAEFSYSDIDGQSAIAFAAEILALRQGSSNSLSIGIAAAFEQIQTRSDDSETALAGGLALYRRVQIYRGFHTVPYASGSVVYVTGTEDTEAGGSTGLSLCLRTNWSLLLMVRFALTYQSESSGYAVGTGLGIGL